MANWLVMEEQFSGKRVFITGATGFIGARLLRRLVGCGAETAALVRENAEHWRVGTYAQKAPLLIRGDLRRPRSFSRELGEFRPEYVFHLAAYGASYSQREIQPSICVNIVGMVNLLQALKKYPGRKFVNLGSAMEYGNVEGEIREELAPAPSSIYGSTKAAATLVAHQLAAAYNFPIVTLRPFGVFGEGEGRERFFCHVILSLLQNKDVPLTGGEQHRDFCYVENIIDGMLLAAGSGQLQNEILNIAGGVSYPLKHYVELISKYCGGSSRPLYGAIPYRENGIWHPQPCIAKIKSLLAWEPRVSLEEGIGKTVDWYRKNINHYL